MVRGKYKRTKEIKEKYSKKKKEKLNPNYVNGKYSKLESNIERAIRIRLKLLEEKANRTYKDKEWIFNKYCIEEMSIQDIAKLCNVDYDTIWFGLRDFGIPRITIIGRKKWHSWVEKTKKLKPFEYADLESLC